MSLNIWDTDQLHLTTNQLQQLSRKLNMAQLCLAIPYPLLTSPNYIPDFVIPFVDGINRVCRRCQVIKLVSVASKSVTSVPSKSIDQMEYGCDHVSRMLVYRLEMGVYQCCFVRVIRPLSISVRGEIAKFSDSHFLFSFSIFLTLSYTTEIQQINKNFNHESV